MHDSYGSTGMKKPALHMAPCPHCFTNHILLLSCSVFLNTITIVVILTETVLICGIAGKVFKFVKNDLIYIPSNAYHKNIYSYHNTIK